MNLLYQNVLGQDWYYIGSVEHVHLYNGLETGDTKSHMFLENNTTNDSVIIDDIVQVRELLQKHERALSKLETGVLQYEKDL